MFHGLKKGRTRLSSLQLWLKCVFEALHALYYSCCVTVSVWKLQNTPSSSTDGFLFALWVGLSLIYQLRVCVNQKSPKISLTPAALSLPPSALTPSSTFTSRCSDTGFRVVVSSPSSLIPSCHSVRLNAGASCHSLSPHAGLISHSFPADDGGGFASQINALHLHFLSHFCITSKVNGGANKLRKQRFVTAEPDRTDG